MAKATARHILVRTEKLCNKIKREIKKKEITFEKAALAYSDDESKNNEGLIINPNSGSSMFIMKDLFLYKIQENSYFFTDLTYDRWFY